MLKLLGTFDIVIAVFLFLFLFGINFHYILIFSSLYLIVKGGIFTFSKDIISAIDLFIGIFLIFSVPKIFLLFSAIFLFQKGFFSIIA